MKQGYTYIMSNINHTVLYVGVTNDIERRVFEHKTGMGSGFTTKYNCTDLLYFEQYPLLTQAIEREKQLKAWKSAWKWALIKKENPALNDMAVDWFDKNELIKVSSENELDLDAE